MITDIQTAKERTRKAKLPGKSATGDAVAKAKKDAPAPSWPTESRKEGAVQTVSATADKAAAVKLMGEGKSPHGRREVVDARAKFQQAQKMPVTWAATDERARQVPHGPVGRRRQALRHSLRRSRQADRFAGRGGPV